MLKNFKVPNSPEDIFDEFTQDLQKAYGKDLISVILYGSGAKGEYVRKKSDINFLVVLTESGIENLSHAFFVIKKWQKRNVAVPLFLTAQYIASSLDSFPIEFYNLQLSYKVVFGEDVLKDLEIAKKFVRLECEEQIKGKLLHLREAFLKTRGHKRYLKALLKATIPDFSSIFSAMLMLKDIDPPRHKKDVLFKTTKIFELDQDVFSKVYGIYENKNKLKKEDLIVLTLRYIKEIRKCAMIVDKL